MKTRSSLKSLKKRNLTIFRRHGKIYAKGKRPRDKFVQG